MPRMCLTGGGTAGHVTPHFAILEELAKDEWRLFYIGSNGIEKEIIGQSEIPFFEIKAGKLRRYLSFQNVIDVGKVAIGFFQSLFILSRQKPDVVFSKGGFVSVPVCLAGWLLRIPVITHESDITPGLATKIISRFATKILYSFPEGERYFPPNPPPQSA